MPSFNNTKRVIAKKTKKKTGIPILTVILNIYEWFSTSVQRRKKSASCLRPRLTGFSWWLVWVSSA
jgi:hypothetical protein